MYLVRAGAAAHSLHKHFDRQLEQAKLQWAQGHQAVAVRLANALLDQAKNGSDIVVYAQMLSLTGKWLAETRYTGHDKTVESYVLTIFKHCNLHLLFAYA